MMRIQTGNSQDHGSEQMTVCSRFLRVYEVYGHDGAAKEKRITSK
jgi:hypothetical protein